jgi:methyl-accepting chemotaxis protein
VEGKLATRADASKHLGDFAKIVQGVNGTLDAVIGPLNVAAEYVDRISKGDIPEKITDSYNGDFNEIKNNLNACIGAVNALVADAGMLSQAAVEGKLATRADASKHLGDFAKIVQGVNDTLDSVIRPLNVAAEYVDRISKGDIPEKITDSYNGDFNEIKNNLNQCIGAVNALVVDAAMLSQAAVEGKLATRADASKHLGDFAKIVQGVNDTLNAVIGPLNVAAEYVDRISKGDIPEKITDNYNGDFNEIKNNLNQCIGAVNALVADAGMLSQAAVEGKLATRADASKHLGDFAKIVQGVNDTLNAVIGPLNVAAEYVDRISKGDIPEKITDNYNGDFNEIKNNLNQCIGAVNALVADAGMLSQAAVEGKLATRADASKHLGDFAKIVQGVNGTLDAVIGPINEAANVLEKLANKDLTARVVGDYAGDLALIKNNLNAAAEALHEVLANTLDATRQVSSISSQVAKGAQDTGKASQQVAETIQQVAKGANEQTATVTTTAKSMEQLNQAIEEVAKGAQAQALSAQDTSRQMNEISHTVEQVARNAQSSAQAAQQVAQTAKTGGDAVQNSIKGMAKITDSTSQSSANIRSLGVSSKQIGEIVDMITDIAEQTNLLALNAAIEAARAGEHGKGFAVVADEVRKLAERSAKATKEIGGLIKSIQAGVETAVTSMEQVAREVEQGSGLAQDAGKALDGIMSGVDGIVGQVQDVSAAAEQMAAGAAEVVKAVENISAITEQSTASTQQMSANSGEVTRSVEQISAISEQNAAAAEQVSAAAEEQNASVEEMSASAQEMAKLAADLEQLVAQFKLENGQAGREIRASAGAGRRTERSRVAAAV